jgi:sulfopyruvate decarboxylase subunit beta
LKRIEAIKKIMDKVNDELVVSSCGMISREVFAVKDRPENFYVQGSMGATLGIGIGLALNTERKITVIAGDGEILMNLGTLVLMNKLRLPNLKLYILDNNCYQTTGGQKTCSDAVDFKKICKENCEVIKVDRAGSQASRIPIPHKEIARRFYNAVNSA